MTLKRLLQSPRTQGITEYGIKSSYGFKLMSDVTEYLQNQVLAFGIRGNVLIVKI